MFIGRMNAFMYGPNEYFEFVRSVLCGFGLGIFQYGPGNQLIDSPV